MGLFGDWKETKETWGRASKLEKAILILGAFLAAAPIASLSDAIFQWRGFLKDGIEFYHYIITEPLGEFLELFNVSLIRLYRDNLVIYLLFSGSWFRLVVLTRRKNTNYLHDLLFVVGMAAIVTLTVVYMSNGKGMSYLGYWWTVLSYIVYVWILYGLQPKKKKWIGILPMILAPILVLIMAALNEGLTR